MSWARRQGWERPLGGQRFVRGPGVEGHLEGHRAGSFEGEGHRVGQAGSDRFGGESAAHRQGPIRCRGRSELFDGLPGGQGTAGQKFACLIGGLECQLSGGGIDRDEPVGRGGLVDDGEGRVTWPYRGTAGSVGSASKYTLRSSRSPSAALVPLMAACWVSVWVICPAPHATSRSAVDARTMSEQARRCAAEMRGACRRRCAGGATGSPSVVIDRAPVRTVCRVTGLCGRHGAAARSGRRRSPRRSAVPPEPRTIAPRPAGG